MTAGTSAEAAVRMDLVHRNGSTFMRRARSTAVERDEHGTLARYTSWGCRCPKCRRARNRYDREWRAVNAAIDGREVRRRVPVSATAQAIRSLRAAGWSMLAIAEAVECSDSTLHRVLRADRAGRGRVWSDIERRVLELADE